MSEAFARSSAVVQQEHASNGPTRKYTSLRALDVYQPAKVPDYDVSLTGRPPMTLKLGHPIDCTCLRRRNFLTLTAGAIAGMAMGGVFQSDEARADALSKEMREKLTRADRGNDEEGQQAFPRG